VAASASAGPGISERSQKAGEHIKQAEGRTRSAGLPLLSPRLVSVLVAEDSPQHVDGIGRRAVARPGDELIRAHQDPRVLVSMTCTGIAVAHDRQREGERPGGSLKVLHVPILGIEGEQGETRPEALEYVAAV